MRTLISVQYLRAIAALAVVCYHYANVVRDDYADGFARWVLGGAAGVDLFFVISGFIMWTISAAREQTPGRFMLRRAVRIVPLYWCVILVAGFVETGSGIGIAWPSDWRPIIESLLFVPAWNEEFPDLVAPIVLVGWTLNLEMAFYAVFAGLLLLPSRPRLIGLCLILAAAVGAGVVIGDTPNAVISLYTRPIVIEFAFGALLGAAYRAKLADHVDASSPRHAGMIGLILLAIGVTLLLSLGGEWGYGSRALTFGVPSVLVLSGALYLEPVLAKRPLAPLKMLGDASYSVYLVHLLPLAVIHRTVAPVMAERSLVATVVVEVAIATVIGVICFQLLERPLTTATSRMVSGRMPIAWRRSSRSVPRQEGH